MIIHTVIKGRKQQTTKQQNKARGTPKTYKLLFNNNHYDKNTPRNAKHVDRP